MEHERAKAVGLKWRDGRAYWFAPKDAVAKGFTPKTVRLHYSDDREIVARCHRLQNEVLMFMSDRGPAPVFDLTFGALIDRYLTDPESSYFQLKPSSLHPYTIYSAKLKKHVGELRIDQTDGRHVQRWFKLWAGVDDLRDPKARLPRARAALSVLKAAVSFGIICKLAGCVEFKTILGELEFPTKKRRNFAPTAAEVEAARSAAHANGAPSRALAYSLQYETTARQWDFIGIWVPLSDPRPSAIIDGNEKWIGATWAMVDSALLLRLTHSKTEDTSGEASVYDLKACPMVMAELEHWPHRTGPLIVNERTGLPYRYEGSKQSGFKEGWKADFAAAGLDKKIWGRDLRAAGVTEGSRNGASHADLAKGAGHVDERMVAEVYDRDRVEAHRRVMALRVAGRAQNGGGTS